MTATTDELPNDEYVQVLLPRDINAFQNYLQESTSFHSRIFIFRFDCCVFYSFISFDGGFSNNFFLFFPKNSNLGSIWDRKNRKNRNRKIEKSNLHSFVFFCGMFPILAVCALCSVLCALCSK